MIPLFLLLILFTVAEGAQQKWKCSDKTWQLDGSICLRIEKNTVRAMNFAAQQNFCASMGANLPCTPTRSDNSQLYNAVVDKYGPDFSPFFIGLRCNKDINLWSWFDSSMYIPGSGNFDDTNTYKDNSCAGVATDATFLLTPEKNWKEISSFPSDFVSQISVCLMPAMPDADDPPKPPDYTALITILVLVVVALIAIIVFLVLKFRKKIRELMTQMMARGDRAEKEDNIYSEYKTPKDSWEVGRQAVDIRYPHKLGTGAFGVVYQGRIDTSAMLDSSGRSILQLSALKLNNGIVAVKMLHESADKLAAIDFLQEIEIMKSIGYHERLVNLIACFTESMPQLLIIEYCSQGNLLGYLKERREHMLQLPSNVDYDTLDKSNIITQEQQMQFAVQIASGMEYLSGRGYVHRDIAARNILVDEHHSCKIGDFGLCRKVQQEQELYVSRGGRLPIKWMSPEALRRYEMSSASDVWSYGILLFEIITLGGSPYPNWEPAEILPRLEAGERMDRPDNCPDEVFEAMCDCWKDEPERRPDFSSLRSRMAKALEQTPSLYYLQLDSQRDYYLVPTSKDLPMLEDHIFRVV